jgi:hypothetical protein
MKWDERLKQNLELAIRDCNWCGVKNICITDSGKICPCKTCIVKMTCADWCKGYGQYSKIIFFEDFKKE